MTNKEKLETLTKAFRALPKDDRRRLKYHLEQGTPIFCGEGADMAYYNDRGFA